MTRVVIDANVLASAAAGHPDSPSRRLLNALASGQIEAVLCDRILRELDRALERPYFAARVTGVERRTLDAVLRAVAEMLRDPVAPAATVRDPATDARRRAWPAACRPAHDAEQSASRQGRAQSKPAFEV